MEEMIRSRINATRDNWVEILADLEFACSSSANDAAKHTPFALNYNVDPKSAHDALLPRATNDATTARIEKISAVALEAKDAIKKAQAAWKPREKK